MYVISYMYSCTHKEFMHIYIYTCIHKLCAYIYIYIAIQCYIAIGVSYVQISVFPKITWVFFPNFCRKRQTTQKADHQPINHQPSPCESSGGLGMTNPTAPRNNVLLSRRNKWPRRPKVMAAMTSTFQGAESNDRRFVFSVNELIGLVAIHARNNIN